MIRSSSATLAASKFLNVVGLALLVARSALPVAHASENHVEAAASAEAPAHASESPPDHPAPAAAPEAESAEKQAQLVPIAGASEGHVEVQTSATSVSTREAQ